MAAAGGHWAKGKFHTKKEWAARKSKKQAELAKKVAKSKAQKKAKAAKKGASKASKAASAKGTSKKALAEIQKDMPGMAGGGVPVGAGRSRNQARLNVGDLS